MLYHFHMDVFSLWKPLAKTTLINKFCSTWQSIEVDQGLFMWRSFCYEQQVMYCSPCVMKKYKGMVRSNMLPKGFLQ